MKHLALAGSFFVAATAAVACTLDIPRVNGSSSQGASSSSAGGSSSSSSSGAGASSSASGSGGGPQECSPRVLVAPQGAQLTSIAVDDSDVYYVSSTEQTIRRVSKHGGASKLFLDGASAIDIALDKSDTPYLYYLGAPNVVARANKSTKATHALPTSDPGTVERIAVDEDAVYWTTSNPCMVRRVSKGDGPPETIAMPGDDADGCGVAAIVVDAAFAYWTGTSRVHQVEKTGANMLTIVRFQTATLQGITAVPGTVYFATPQQLRVADAGVDGGAAHVVLVGVVNSPSGLVNDGVNLYFGDLADGGGAVEKLGLTADEPKRLSFVPDSVVERIAFDDDCVYFTSKDGSVRQAPKSSK